jgi:hypothetical protein
VPNKITVRERPVIIIVATKIIYVSCPYIQKPMNHNEYISCDLSGIIFAIATSSPTERIDIFSADSC